MQKLRDGNTYLLVIVFWNYDTENDKYFIANKLQTRSFVTKLTIDDWNKLGINETNADFEKVED